MSTPNSNKRTAATPELDPVALAKEQTNARLRQQQKQRLLRRRQRKSGQ